MILIEIIYLINVILLAMYGLNALFMAVYRSRWHKPIPVQSAPQDYDWPTVTVQLPVYNERYVVERLIEAGARLDYPVERLYIQVLDDSTDNTREIIAQAIARQRASGFQIEQIHRSERIGYKGGALEYGLHRAQGEFIAIFDADFVPSPDFLKKTIPYFELNPRLGCVQTRWGHLNRETSWLTRTQANGIDGHFMIEQETRSETSLFLNFNGTAGVWRKACIQATGGWHHDTLTEDLDLSYRAQLRGWQIRYLPHVVTPAELPAQINAFKRQQFRWAKGSLQTARKLLGSLWSSPTPLLVKIEGTIHLTHYTVHPLMLLNLLLMLPLLHSGSRLLHLYPVFILGALGPLLMYTIAMAEQNKPYTERLANLMMLVLLGMGLSLNNTRAVLEGVLGIQSSFQRTPKFNLQGRERNSQTSDYLLPRDWAAWLETILALYTAGLLVYTLLNGVWGLVVWLSLYCAGYLYITSLNFEGAIHSICTLFSQSRRSRPDTQIG